VIYNTE